MKTLTKQEMTEKQEIEQDLASTLNDQDREALDAVVQEVEKNKEHALEQIMLDIKNVENIDERDLSILNNTIKHLDQIYNIDAKKFDFYLSHLIEEDKNMYEGDPDPSVLRKNIASLLTETTMARIKEEEEKSRLALEQEIIDESQISDGYCAVKARPSKAAERDRKQQHGEATALLGKYEQLCMLAKNIEKSEIKADISPVSQLMTNIRKECEEKYGDLNYPRAHDQFKKTYGDIMDDFYRAAFPPKSK